MAESESHPDFAELAKLRDNFSLVLSKPVELPELALVFDLGDRKGNSLRTYKAIVQTTQIHAEHFRQATARSHLAILDAYVDATSLGQLVVAQSMARSMLELNGLLHEIYSRLSKVVSRVDETNWESLGHSYWGTIVRARLGTSDPSVKQMLLSLGVSTASVKPFGVTDCLRNLSTESGFTDVESRYSMLCDAVHHNFGSRVGSLGAIRNGDRGAIGEGGWVTKGTGPILRYEYPGAPDFLAAHIARTVPGMLIDTKACISWMNQTPKSPFPMEMTERITGNPVGMGTSPT